jgi:hypothetical protein
MAVGKSQLLSADTRRENRIDVIAPHTGLFQGFVERASGGGLDPSGGDKGAVIDQAVIIHDRDIHALMTDIDTRGDHALATSNGPLPPLDILGIEPPTDIPGSECTPRIRVSAL